MLHNVRRMALAYVVAKIHVRPLAEKLLLLLFKANILFFLTAKRHENLVPSAVNMPAKGRILARRSLETSQNKGDFTINRFEIPSFLDEIPNHQEL
jgi:hypothetical protein